MILLMTVTQSSVHSLQHHKTIHVDKPRMRPRQEELGISRKTEIPCHL